MDTAQATVSLQTCRIVCRACRVPTWIRRMPRLRSVYLRGFSRAPGRIFVQWCVVGINSDVRSIFLTAALEMPEGSAVALAATPRGPPPRTGRSPLSWPGAAVGREAWRSRRRHSGTCWPRAKLGASSPDSQASGWHASAGDAERPPWAWARPPVRKLASRSKPPGATTLAPLQREILRVAQLSSGPHDNSPTPSLEALCFPLLLASPRRFRT